MAVESMALMIVVERAGVRPVTWTMVQGPVRKDTPARYLISSADSVPITTGFS